VKTERFKGALLSFLIIASIMALAIPLLSPSPVHAALTPHDLIYIDGDDNFIPANGVTSGSGTENDPYIIENWDIWPHYIYENGIEVRNTTAYFIIRNCYVHSGASCTRGICFEGVINGIVENNILNNNDYGIYLSGSNNNLISGNTFVNNGLFVWDSYQNIVENNTVNGRPLVYLEEKSDHVVADAGQIILVRCENITVKSLNLSNATIGVELWEIDNSMVINNIVENNRWRGIILGGYSSNNLISGNIVKNNGGGIWLEDSDNNLIENNIAENNPYGGIYLRFSNNNLIENNIAENNPYGIDLDYSDNNLISGNIVGNNYHGIDLDYSDNNLISGNYVQNNRAGIILGGYSSNNLLSGNIVENHFYGIILGYYPSNNLLFGNIVENNYYGIEFAYGSYNNLIYHNNIVNNTTQAYDEGANYWDNGYPSGGNYWSDYTGVDNYGGENQGMPRRDRIGDTPYYISGDNNFDRYPLMNPFPLPWTGWARFSLLPIVIQVWPPPNIYQVLLEMNLALYQGSKLVVKFYTYDNVFENQSVIHENFALPWRVEENRTVAHPSMWIAVKKAKLLLVDDVGNEISKIKGWVTIRDDLWGRLMAIRAKWPYASPENRENIWKELLGIRSLWPYAPNTRDPAWVDC